MVLNGGACKFKASIFVACCKIEAYLDGFWFPYRNSSRRKQ